KYKRSSDDFEEFLISLISNGYSKNQIQRTLKKLELPYSEQEIEKIKENLKEKVDDFKTRQLKEDWFCMMIDGSRSQIKDKQLKEAVIYVILLIGLDGKKEIGGWYKEELKKIMVRCERFEEAIESFSKLIEKFRKKYPYFMNKLEKNKERYFSFKKKYPKEIQKYIYTTNACENINRQIEDRRIKCGGYFQSIEVVDINSYLIWENLENGRWRKPIPNLKGNEYKIRQLFKLRFGKEVSQTQKS
ncbi:transposase, partial [bacterium]|nr:transposase [bacterium]